MDSEMVPESRAEGRRGRLLYNIIYDLGGSVCSPEKFLEALNKRYNASNISHDLSLYNFSHLSTIDSPILIEEKKIHFADMNWDERIVVDPSGYIHFVLYSEWITDNNDDELVRKLISTHDLFIDDKNKDYIRYLNQEGALTNSLSMKKVDEEGVIDFRNDVSILREIATSFVDPRPLYKFHDYRPIFQIDKPCELDNYLLQSLLDLSPVTQGNTETASPKEECFRFGNITMYGRTWSYIVSGIDEELFSLFQLAHKYWFMAQGWIFTLKESNDQYIVLNENTLEQLEDRVYKEAIHKIRIAKSDVFEQLMIIQNSDFIIKNTALNRTLSFLTKNFNTDKQIDILEKQADRLSKLLDESYSYYRNEKTEKLEKNSRILQFLFAINTIAGIGSFAPQLFSSGIENNLTLDTPRIISLSLMGISIIIYMGYYLGTKIQK